MCYHSNSSFTKTCTGDVLQNGNVFHIIVDVVKFSVRRNVTDLKLEYSTSLKETGLGELDVTHFTRDTKCDIITTRVQTLKPFFN